MSGFLGNVRAVILLAAFFVGVIALIVHADRQARKEHPQPYTAAEIMGMGHSIRNY